MQQTVLVRYGAIPEVARFACPPGTTVQHGAQVVVDSPRGVELGTVLEVLKPKVSKSSEGEATGEATWHVIREATSDDQTRADELRTEGEEAFEVWRKRIGEWQLELELIDIEWMLDQSKLILYVLNDRGPDCTKLLLRIAAADLGAVDVQPVSADGLMQIPRGGGGCGSGGGCGCDH